MISFSYVTRKNPAAVSDGYLRFCKVGIPGGLGDGRSPAGFRGEDQKGGLRIKFQKPTKNFVN